MQHIGQGATSVMLWEGFDSVYNHAIRAGRGTTPPNDTSGLPLPPVAYNQTTGTYAPRAIFYQDAQIFKFVSPGSTRIAATTSLAGMQVYAFTHARNGQVTIIGHNTGSARTIAGTLVGVPSVQTLQIYQTHAAANMQRGADIAVVHGHFLASISARTYFTLTTGVTHARLP